MTEVNSNLLEEGQVFLLEPHHTVYTDLPLHFLGKAGNWEIRKNACITLDVFGLEYLCTKYVVNATAQDGGGGGPYSPSGHRVYAVSICGGHYVNFYQTGGFTALNKDIPVVGYATRRWEYSESKEKK